MVIDFGNKKKNRYREDDQEVERKVGDDDPPPRSKLKIALIAIGIVGLIAGASVAAVVLAPEHVPDKIEDKVRELMERLGFDIEMEAAMEADIAWNEDLNDQNSTLYKEKAATAKADLERLLVGAEDVESVEVTIEGFDTGDAEAGDAKGRRSQATRIRYRAKIRRRRRRRKKKVTANNWLTIYLQSIGKADPAKYPTFNKFDKVEVGNVKEREVTTTAATTTRNWFQSLLPVTKPTQKPNRYWSSNRPTTTTQKTTNTKSTSKWILPSGPKKNCKKKYRRKYQAAEGFESRTDEIPNCLHTCGNNKNDARGQRIINGKIADNQDWPFIAKLHLYFKHRSNGRTAIGCGATILNNRWLLTAAHCLSMLHKNVYRTAMLGKSKAIFGTKNSRTSSDYFNIKIQKLFPHPKYEEIGYVRDIGLVKLEKDIFETAKAQKRPCIDGCINAVCLPVAHDRGGSACWVAGWGIQQNKNTVGYAKYKPQWDGLLHSVGVNTMSHSYCEKYSIHKDAPPKKSERGKMCAGIPDHDGDGIMDGGKDTCQGDSGGPLICEVDGRYTITGIVSYGYGCADVGFAGVYTRVYTHFSWMETTIEENGDGDGVLGHLYHN